MKAVRFRFSIWVRAFRGAVGSIQNLLNLKQSGDELIADMFIPRSTHLLE
jgi:hypothetical protein